MPRYREGDPEPEGVPSPTQARADFILVRVAGEEEEYYLPPQNKDVPLVYGPGAAGSAVVGDMLTCTMGNWTGVPISYTYQWQKDDSPIGTNSGSYTVVAADSGASINCIVTATNEEGSTAAPPSNAVVIP